MVSHIWIAIILFSIVKTTLLLHKLLAITESLFVFILLKNQAWIISNVINKKLITLLLCSLHKRNLSHFSNIDSENPRPLLIWSRVKFAKPVNICLKRLLISLLTYSICSSFSRYLSPQICLISKLLLDIIRLDWGFQSKPNLINIATNWIK